MDIPHKADKTPIWRKYWYLLPLTILVVGTVVAKRTLGDASYLVSGDEIRLATVEAGPFDITVRANGILKPREIRWVGATSSGRAEAILVEPGESVAVGQPIVRLSNAALEHQLQLARWEADAVQAEAHSDKLRIDSEIVTMETQALEAEFAFRNATLNLDAEKELLSKHNGLISRLTHERSKLAVEQTRHRWHALQRQTDNLKANSDAVLAAQTARLALAEGRFQRLSEEVEGLVIEASISGVLQSIAIEPGQQATIGQSIALIASQDSLLAQLAVQELNAGDIQVGQRVDLDTRSTQFAGRVQRVDPASANGTVQVDVEILSDLPPEARPDLNVEGTIQISLIEQTLMVQRPALSPAHGETDLFVIQPDSATAKRTRVAFGQSSPDRIQILAGLSKGDQVIVSDTSDWQSHPTIYIH